MILLCFIYRIFRRCKVTAVARISATVSILKVNIQGILSLYPFSNNVISGIAKKKKSDACEIAAGI